MSDNRHRFGGGWEIPSAPSQSFLAQGLSCRSQPEQPIKTGSSLESRQQLLYLLPGTWTPAGQDREELGGGRICVAYAEREHFMPHNVCEMLAGTNMGKSLLRSPPPPFPQAKRPSVTGMELHEITSGRNKWYQLCDTTFHSGLLHSEPIWDTGEEWHTLLSLQSLRL